MRIQSINPNNYSNSNYKKGTSQNPKFKANVHSIVDVTCHEGDICELAMAKLSSLFTKVAIESGKIKPENAEGVYVGKGTHGYIDLLLLDKTTPLSNDLSNIKNREMLEQRLAIAPFDEETEELAFSASEKDVCPIQDESFNAAREFLRRIFGDGE